tara:strand:+ start:12466 stop:16341 length:3876 start_codon:yes stop_codon:yes gene_type:complete
VAENSGLTCDATLAAADIEEASHRHDFNIKCQNVVASMIGFPNMRRTKLALKQYKETNKKSDKRKYEMHKRKYVAHKVLFDLLEGDIMDAYDSVSSASANPGELANPTTLLKGWQQIFHEYGHGIISPLTAQVGSRKMQSMGGLVRRIQKKRATLQAKGGNIPKYIIAIAPPQLVTSWADRYGVVAPIIERVLRQSDTNVQQTSKYGQQFEEANKEASEVFDILKDDLQKDVKSRFNMNNAAMSELYTNLTTGEISRTGIKGVRLVDRKTKGWTKDSLQRIKYGIGSEVIITGQKMRNNVMGYMFVTEDNQGADPKWLPEDAFDKTTEEMQELLVDKYKSELLYELGSGQVRHVIPKTINMDVDDEGFVAKHHEGLARDIKRIRQKLNEMRLAAEEARDTGVTRRVPGVHTQQHTDASGVTWEYRYVMLKQGEGNVDGESYHLYLLDKAESVAGKRIENGRNVNFIGNSITMLGDNIIAENKGTYYADEINAVMGTEGFYRSDSYNDFGQYTNKEGEPIFGTQKKRLTSFRRMKQQPNEAAMPAIWKLLSSVRSIYSQVWAETSVMVGQTEAERVKWDKSVRAQLKNNGYTEEEILEYFDTIYNAGGIEHNLRRDEETNELRMPHMYAMPKSENYMPSLYNKTNIMIKQIPLQVRRLESKIQEFKLANPDGKDEKLNKVIERYEEGLEHLSSILRQFTEQDLPDHNVFDLDRVHALKHITAWTDPLEVRKDKFVINDYLNNMYSSINRNKTTVELLKALHKGNRIDKATIKGEGMLNGTMNYMVNRVKIAYGDTSSRAMTIFGNERSYDAQAESLNSLPDGLTGGVKWDGKAAEKLTKWLTAPMTMLHLGGSAAVVNNTQIVNRFIKVGWHGTSEALKLYKNKDKNGWGKIIDNTGVLNILSVFEDIMLKDGNPEWNDAGLLDILGIPAPTRNLVHFLRLISKGRQSFIDGGEGFQETDEFLAMIEHRNQGKSREDIQDLRKTNQLLKDLSKDDMKRKRGEYYDIWSLEKGVSEEIIKKRFKQLVGDVADSQLKKMVSWKLSWWFGEDLAGKGIFTFTETEKNLRSVTAISAIMDAKRNGLLGDANDDSIYYSDAAVKVARNAVYAEQFGMTPPHMGELFNGFGRYVWQYKQYPTNQVIHDYRVWRKFADGNYDWIDGVERITRAMVHMSTTRGDLSDTKSQEYDQEAIQMGRFLFTRATASALGTMASTVPYLSWIIRRGIGGADISSFIRGAENPILATTFRSMLYVTLIGMGMAGDDEREEALLPWQYLLVPVMIGTFIRFISDALDD